MSLANIMLSETQKEILYDSIYMKCGEQINPQRQKEISGFQEQGGGWREVTANGCGVSLGVDENVLELESSDGFTTL